jgi:hypothetical protein
MTIEEWVLRFCTAMAFAFDESFEFRRNSSDYGYIPPTFRLKKEEALEVSKRIIFTAITDLLSTTPDYEKQFLAEDPEDLAVRLGPGLAQTIFTQGVCS